MSSSLPTNIGLIGLGVMGRPIGESLLQAGFPLTVFTRSPERAKGLVDAGASWSATAKEVAGRSDIVITCLPDTPDVEHALFQTDGVMAGSHRGTVVIDCSTIAPGATRAFAQRLNVAGIEMLDCPVSGGSKAAKTGSLSCFVGGEEATVNRCLPVLRAFGKNIVHVGPVGAGQTVKACNQMVICATLLGISEAIVLCKKSGIDPEKMRDALSGGAANSFVLLNHAKRILARTVQSGFRVELMHKDLKHAATLTRNSGVFSPVTDISVQMFSALCQRGHGGADSAAIGLLIEELSGGEGPPPAIT